MLTIKDEGILRHIIDHCKRIEDKVFLTTKNNFLVDKDLQEIICFNIFQIGELVKKLTEEFISIYNKVPWNKIKKMRDVIGHGYGTINMDRVWETSIFDVKELHSYCENIIKDNR